MFYVRYHLLFCTCYSWFGTAHHFYIYLMCIVGPKPDCHCCVQASTKRPQELSDNVPVFGDKPPLRELPLPRSFPLVQFWIARLDFSSLCVLLKLVCARNALLETSVSTNLVGSTKDWKQRGIWKTKYLGICVTSLRDGCLQNPNARGSTQPFQS